MLLIPVSLLIVVTISFGLVALIPGDPAVAILGEFATADEVAALRKDLQLDQPLAVRYANYVQRVLSGDLGRSFFTRQPILDDIRTYLPNTLELVIPALLISAALGLVLGALAAYYQRRWGDSIVAALVTCVQSLPDFVLALVLIYFAFVELRIVPAPIGRLSLDVQMVSGPTRFLLIDSLLSGRLDVFGSALGHLVLPALTLGITHSAAFAKTVRSTLGAALAAPQVEFARACGLRELMVIRYGLLAVRTPILTYGAILFGSLVGGVAIVETIFGWRGIGQWAVEGMLRVDVPVIQGFVIVGGLATLLIYLILDIVVAILDPRISYA